MKPDSINLIFVHSRKQRFHNGLCVMRSVLPAAVITLKSECVERRFDVSDVV